MPEGFAMVPVSAINAPVDHCAFRLLVALIAHANKEGRCHPSNSRLAEVTGIARRNVIRSLHDLEAASLIEVDQSGQRRTIKVTPSVMVTPSDKSKSSVMTTPPQCHDDTTLQVSDSVMVRRASVKVTPPSEHTKNREERERETGGSNSTLAIAEKIVREVWHVTDEFEVETQAGTIRHYIDGYSEAACLAAAATARGKARDPVRYFVGMCQRGGLTDPTKREAPVANGQAPARVAPERETIAQARSRRLREDAEREKARRAAAQQESNHAGQ